MQASTRAVLLAGRALLRGARRIGRSRRRRRGARSRPRTSGSTSRRRSSRGRGARPARSRAIHERVTEAVGWRPERPIDVLVGDPQATANGMAFPFLDRPGDRALDVAARAGVRHRVLDGLDGRPRRARGRAHRPPDAAAQPLARDPRASLAAPDRAAGAEVAALAHGRLRDADRGRADRLGTAGVELPRDGAAPVRDRGKASVLRGALLDVGLARRLDGVPRRLDVPRVARGERGEGQPAEALEAHGVAARRDFPTAFRAVFGRSPADLYDRFRAEVTAAALEEEKRLGRPVSSTASRGSGSTAARSRSRSRPTARSSSRGATRSAGETYLAVWTIARGRGGAAGRGEAARARGGDSQRSERGRRPSGAPAAAAPRSGGCRASTDSPAENPRWMPDGGACSSRGARPTRTACCGSTSTRGRRRGRRPTRDPLADVVEADPRARRPLGRGRAHPLRRLGARRVDLASGEVASSFPRRRRREDAWRVWSHPRVSPDGATIAALLHSGGRWRLVTLPAGGGELREIALPGSPAGAPAWSADGSRIFVATDREGIWNVESVRTSRDRPDCTRADPRASSSTRVTGGALAPAPSPDGKSLFFLEVTSKGVDVQRLALPAAAARAAAVAARRAFRCSRRTRSPRRRSRGHPSRRTGRTGSGRATSSVRSRRYSLGPDGNSWQIGVEGSDVVGRLDWVAARRRSATTPARAAHRSPRRSAGCRSRSPRSVFSAREKPGSQRVVRRREFDQERLGGFLEASWGGRFPGGRVRVDAGGGERRGSSRSPEATTSIASLVSLRARASARRVRGKSGFGARGRRVRLGGSDGRRVVAAVSRRAPASPRFLPRRADLGLRPLRRHERIADALRRLLGRRRAVARPARGRSTATASSSPRCPRSSQVGARVETARAELALRTAPDRSLRRAAARVGARRREAGSRARVRGGASDRRAVASRCVLGRARFLRGRREDPERRRRGSTRRAVTRDFSTVRETGLARRRLLIVAARAVPRRRARGPRSARATLAASRRRRRRLRDPAREGSPGDGQLSGRRRTVSGHRVLARGRGKRQLRVPAHPLLDEPRIRLVHPTHADSFRSRGESVSGPTAGRTAPAISVRDRFVRRPQRSVRRSGGKLDARRIGVAGYSYGGHSAQLVAERRSRRRGRARGASPIRDRSRFSCCPDRAPARGS